MSIQLCDSLVDAAGTGAPDTPFGLKLAGGSSPLTIYKPWAAWTPSFVGLGAPTQVVCFKRQIGDTMEVNGTFTVGTPTATPCAIVMAGETIDLTKIQSGGHNAILGFAQIMKAGNNVFATVGQTPMLFFDGATSNLWFALSTSAGAFTAVNGSTAFSLGDVVNFRIFALPIT